MTSKSQKTEIKRKQKREKQGKKRKRELQNKGSTPSFSIDPEGN